MKFPRTQAQKDQQDNRDNGGRWTKQAPREDPGNDVLIDERELTRHVTRQEDPAAVTLRTETAAAMLRDLETDVEGRLTRWADSQEQVTMLIADSQYRSNYVVEGRIAEVTDDGKVAMWPKGLRARGFFFPLGSVQTVRQGYGHTDQILHDLAGQPVPALSDDHQFDRLPKHNPAVHDRDDTPVQVVFLLRHREAADQLFVSGCALAAVSADDNNVYGYLWAPASSGVRSRFVQTSRARVEAMGCRVGSYQPGTLTAAGCAGLPDDRVGMYQALAGG